MKVIIKLKQEFEKILHDLELQTGSSQFFVWFLMFRNYFIQMIYNKFQKFVPQGEARHKLKKQCLKNKNILYENEQIQIGCKVTALYDFYSSENHLQINIFIGNKA